MSDFRDEAVALATEHGCKDLCELGVWRGDLSRRLAALAKERGGTLTLVDPMTVADNKFLMNFADGDLAYPFIGQDATKLSKLYTCTMGEPEKTQAELNEMWNALTLDIPWARFIRESSLYAYLLVRDATLDFIFIDSVHLYNYCLAEIKAWLPKLRPGGIMAGDDYVPDHRAVARAVDEVFGKKPRQGIWWEKVK